jgi:hypothetical protein
MDLILDEIKTCPAKERLDMLRAIDSTLVPKILPVFRLRFFDRAILPVLLDWLSPALLASKEAASVEFFRLTLSLLHRLDLFFFWSPFVFLERLILVWGCRIFESARLADVTACTGRLLRVCETAARHEDPGVAAVRALFFHDLSLSHRALFLRFPLARLVVQLSRCLLPRLK